MPVDARLRMWEASWEAICGGLVGGYVETSWEAICGGLVGGYMWRPRGRLYVETSYEAICGDLVGGYKSVKNATRLLVDVCRWFGGPL